MGQILCVKKVPFRTYIAWTTWEGVLYNPFVKVLYMPQVFHYA